MVEQLIWVDPDDNEFDFTDGVNYFITRGQLGHLMEPFQILYQTAPDIPGAIEQEVVAMPRTLTIPLFMQEDSRQDFIDRNRALAKALSPKRGLGYLKHVDQDAENRLLYCKYMGGLTGDTNVSLNGSTWAISILQFQALDPNWYSDTPISHNLSLSEAGDFFPILPFTLGDSSIFSQVTINNTGDINAYPVFTILGPIQDFEAQNVTTGKAFKLDYSVIGSEIVTVDCRPRKISEPGFIAVSNDDGDNLYPYLTKENPASELFYLEPGYNVIKVLGGSTTINTDIDIDIIPAFHSW